MPDSAVPGTPLGPARDERTPRTVYIPSAAVCVFGGIQPGILISAVDEEHRQSGLMARLLLAHPPRKAKQWREDTVPDDVHKGYVEVLERLYTMELGVGPDGSPHPQVLWMTPEAKALWVAFYNKHGQEQVDLDGDLAAAWSKLEGYTARFALIVHCVRWAAGDPSLVDPDQIDEASMAAGIELSSWFKYEERRVYALLEESEEERKRRGLCELIERRGGEITPRDLYRINRRFKKVAQAEAKLAALVQDGLGHWEFDQPGPKGGRPSKRFVLNPTADADETSLVNDHEGFCRQDGPNGGGDDPAREAETDPEEGWGEV